MLRVLAVALSLFGAAIGGLYTAARADDSRSVDVAAERAVLDPVPDPVEVAPVAIAALEPAPLPVGIDAPELAAWAEPGSTVMILDEETGLSFDLYLAPVAEEVIEEPARASSSGRRVSRAPAAPILRLDSDPGRHVILTARGMMARNETVRGSCYRYLSEVFERAGHDDWRTRTIVHASDREGPYADLSRIRPGDWLYIVNHPETTPMGTHSVLFLGWDDRAHGYARVLQHSGGGSASAGDERSYDVSRTYRIVRPRLPD